MKSALVQVYLFFSGRCEEALEFYRSTLGAEVQFLMKHKESPDAPPPGMLSPGWEDKVMHTSFRVGDTVVMASDGCGPGGQFSGFSLSLALPTEADVRRVFAALSAGGEVKMPPVKTFWSPCFGMLTDQFGVGWMVTVAPEK